ncbi:Bifunctional solanapyrone synthase [Lachnellula subtilissima]|uniref:Bifunctional solanapyrone synthase n=1 Tax=Lachnellula subtilissima TaxID=602034 RepID=A0A8H8RRB9_9HELO|nr:Bifunctional solanapyrone synthase [Lachnellula subtilissima]
MVNGTKAAALCCLKLSLLLKEQIAFPGSQPYTDSLVSYFSLQEANVKPACVASPQNIQDVSTIVHALTNPVAPCYFAIRSGGHSSFAGAANVQDGVTIDLRGLNSIDINPDGPLVSVGVGASWGSVYTQLGHYNLSVAGARAFSVAVGGLSIGGGISYFAPRYGWTCDTVINYVVVLANGSIINANQQENPDLLWALRGGTNNFGIVVRVDLQVFQQGNIWGGVISHALSTASQQIEALSEFNSDGTYNQYCSLISSFAYSGAAETSFIINNMEYTKALANPPAFQNFSSIPFLTSTMRITNMTDLVTETETLQMSGFRQASATLTIQSTQDALKAIVNAWNASVPLVQDIPGIVWGIALEPLPSAIYGRHAETNALGLTERNDTPLMIVLLSITWNEADDDDRIDKEAKALIGTLELELGSLGVLDPFVYLNYAASWQKPISSYGEANVKRLFRIQEEYDPHRVFTDYVSGGFKLGD